MTRQTKAELQTELRNLNRGYPRQPVSKMKHHELEAAIDAIKKVKGEALATLETKPPVARGPPGPRPVEVEEVVSGPTTIRTPKMPPVKDVGVPKGKKPGKVISSPDEHSSTVKTVSQKKTAPADTDLFPAVKVPPVPRQKSAPVHLCNCPSCPTKSKSE